MNPNYEEYDGTSGFLLVNSDFQSRPEHLHSYQYSHSLSRVCSRQKISLTTWIIRALKLGCISNSVFPEDDFKPLSSFKKLAQIWRTNIEIGSGQIFEFGSRAEWIQSTVFQRILAVDTIKLRLFVAEIIICIQATDSMVEHMDHMCSNHVWSTFLLLVHMT